MNNDKSSKTKIIIIVDIILAVIFLLVIARLLIVGYTSAKRLDLQVNENTTKDGDVDLDSSSTISDDSSTTKYNFTLKKDARKTLEDYYENTLIAEYGVADPDMVFYCEEVIDDIYDYQGIICTGSEGKQGLMGKMFVDVDQDENVEMLVGKAQYNEGTINVQILVYDVDTTTGSVTELTDGHIKSFDFGLENDTVQCAYRLFEDGLYIYFTKVYTWVIHEGGYGYGSGMVYRLSSHGVEQLTQDTHEELSKYDDMMFQSAYMPTIVDAWFALSGDRFIPNSWEFVCAINQIGDSEVRYSSPLFIPLSKTDASYTDIFSWQLGQIRGERKDHYSWVDSIFNLYGYFDFYESNTNAPSVISKSEWENINFDDLGINYVGWAMSVISIRNITYKNSNPYTRVVPGEYDDWKSILYSIQMGDSGYTGIEEFAASRIEGARYYFTKDDLEKLAYSLTGKHMQLDSLQEAYDYLCSIYNFKDNQEWFYLYNDKEKEYLVFNISGEAGYMGPDIRTLETIYKGDGTWELCYSIVDPADEWETIPAWSGYMYATAVVDSESILGGFRLENIRWDDKWHDFGSFGKKENEHKDKAVTISDVKISEEVNHVLSTDYEGEYSFSCMVNGKEMTGTFVDRYYDLVYVGPDDYIVYDVDGDGDEELIIGVELFANGRLAREGCSTGIHVMKVTKAGFEEIYNHHNSHYEMPMGGRVKVAQICNDKLTVTIGWFSDYENDIFEEKDFYFMFDEYGLILKSIDDDEKLISSYDKKLYTIL